MSHLTDSKWVDSRRNPARTWRVAAVVLCLAAIAWTSGCAGTRQTRSAEPRGFLGDYSMMNMGQGEQAQLIYVHQRTDFSAFDKIYLEPVTLWVAPGSSLHRVTRHELQRLSDYLYNALWMKLALDYTMVEQPGPGTLRVRAAITDAKKSKIVLDIASSVIPPALVATSALGAATDIPLTVGRASIEIDITDSLSGQRLVAVVDERMGTKWLKSAHREWADVEIAYDVWAEQLRTRLRQLRDGQLWY